MTIIKPTAPQSVESYLSRTSTFALEPLSTVAPCRGAAQSSRDERVVRLRRTTRQSDASHEQRGCPLPAHRWIAFSSISGRRRETTAVDRLLTIGEFNIANGPLSRATVPAWARYARCNMTRDILNHRKVLRELDCVDDPY